MSSPEATSKKKLEERGKETRQPTDVPRDVVGVAPDKAQTPDPRSKEISLMAMKKATRKKASKKGGRKKAAKKGARKAKKKGRRKA